MTDEPIGTCHSCGTTLTRHLLGREEVCPGCRRDTRVCLNCKNYERGRNNDCKEPQADRVVNKDKSNFCDFFMPGRAGTAANDSAAKARAAAEALFKKK